MHGADGGCVGLGELKFMLLRGINRGASKPRCGYYRALAAFHMALSPAKYTITSMLSSCLYSRSLPFSEFSQYPSAREG